MNMNYELMTHTGHHIIAYLSSHHHLLLYCYVCITHLQFSSTVFSLFSLFVILHSSTWRHNSRDNPKYKR